MQPTQEHLPRPKRNRSKLGGTNMLILPLLLMISIMLVVVSPTSQIIRAQRQRPHHNHLDRHEEALEQSTTTTTTTTRGGSLPPVGAVRPLTSKRVTSKKRKRENEALSSTTSIRLSSTALEICGCNNLHQLDEVIVNTSRWGVKNCEESFDGENIDMRPMLWRQCMDNFTCALHCNLYRRQGTAIVGTGDVSPHSHSTTTTTTNTTALTVNDKKKNELLAEKLCMQMVDNATAEGSATLRRQSSAATSTDDIAICWNFLFSSSMKSSSSLLSSFASRSVLVWPRLLTNRTNSLNINVVGVGGRFSGADRLYTGDEDSICSWSLLLELGGADEGLVYSQMAQVAAENGTYRLASGEAITTTEIHRRSLLALPTVTDTYEYANDVVSWIFWGQRLVGNETVTVTDNHQFNATACFAAAWARAYNSDAAFEDEDDLHRGIELQKRNLHLSNNHNHSSGGNNTAVVPPFCPTLSVGVGGFDPAQATYTSGDQYRDLLDYMNRSAVWRREQKRRSQQQQTTNVVLSSSAGGSIGAEATLVLYDVLLQTWVTVSYVELQHCMQQFRR